eukprot:TRINITY_DN2908_c0_g1_i1.p1 TRINITY_DN2908_c0_g1~~TRINITY_DN2908_c0_g1_i1.p1  ORF type:complete len:457 (-),score=92.06 TRINITY_DN2908_c0_g1_i1:26-1396(-)
MLKNDVPKKSIFGDWVDYESLESEPVEAKEDKKEKNEEKVDEEKKESEIKLESNCEEKVHSFEELHLKEDLLKGIWGAGIIKPSPIQQQAILPLLKKRDTIAQAQSGTGKTATFAISILHLTDEKIDKVQALVVSPTRELALQITQVIADIGGYLNVKVVSCIGGTSIKEDIIDHKKGAHVVVGTTGRVLDLMKKEFFKSDSLSLLIVDDADEMLTGGSKEQLQGLFQYLFADIQVGLFFSTMPKETFEITKQFMRDPAMIFVKEEDLIKENIRQYNTIIVEEKSKFNVLSDILKNLGYQYSFMGTDIQQAIIFCNSRKIVDFLAQEMKTYGFSVCSIHGEMDQSTRSSIVKEFQTGSSRTLVTTEAFGCKIDVQQVSLIVNFDLPRSKEYYYKRISRTGRLGRAGIAINFVGPKDATFLKEVQDYFHIVIPELPEDFSKIQICLLYTSPSPRDRG